MIKQHKSGIFYEPSPGVLAIIKGALEAYQYIYDHLTPDDVVLDLGGWIGDVAKMCSSAKQVITFEPNSTNYKFIIERQQLGPNCIVFNKAVSNKAGITTFTISKNSSSHHIGASVTHDTETVELVSFADIIAEYNPTIIKIDIEGAEYDLPFELISDNVKMLAIEVHYSHGHHWYDDFDVEPLEEFRKKSV